MAATKVHLKREFMALILLEALGALLILVGIVWWTMFSGRKRGELPDAPEPGHTPALKKPDSEQKVP